MMHVGELIFEMGGKNCASMIHDNMDQIFAKHGLTPELLEEVFAELREITRPKLCTPEGKWWIDYTRLRV